MPRSLWTGSVSFGLVNVPVRLAPGTRDLSVRFHQLHAKDNARIEVRRFCSAEDKEVAWEEIAHGYELEDGNMVVLTDEELEAADPKHTRTIDIEAFVDEEDIDPIYYDRPYLLVPEENEGVVRAYHLLREVMERSGRVAIARFVLRTKERIAAIRVRDGALTLTTMFFHDEIRGRDWLDGAVPDKAKAPSKDELEGAVSLIEAMSRDFDPNRYEDVHRKRLLELIQRKRKGQEIELPEEPEAPAAVPDLMAALEASLERSRGGGGGDGDDGGGGKKRAPSGDGRSKLEQMSREELYERAQKKKVPGRSKMSKDELVEALSGS
ncbi:MAG: Ku protein [Thermoleophilaceae bacterium]